LKSALRVDQIKSTTVRVIVVNSAEIGAFRLDLSSVIVRDLLVAGLGGGDHRRRIRQRACVGPEKRGRCGALRQQ
jgi:hypothetical protein